MMMVEIMRLIWREGGRDAVLGSDMEIVGANLIFFHQRGRERKRDIRERERKKKKRESYSNRPLI